MLASITTYPIPFSPSIPSAPDESSIYVDSNTRIQVLETMMDLPTADREQLAAFIVRLFSRSFHHFCRVTPYCFRSGMNVYWSFGPPPSRLSFPPAMISRNVSSNSCGDPAPQPPVTKPVPKEQAPLRTLFLTILPNQKIHSRPLPFLATALSSVSSLPPQVPVSRTAS